MPVRRAGPVSTVILSLIGLGLLVGAVLLSVRPVVTDHDGSVYDLGQGDVYEASNQHVRLRCFSVLSAPDSDTDLSGKGDERTRPIYGEDDVLGSAVTGDDGSPTAVAALDDGLYVDRVEALRTCDQARSRRGGEAAILGILGFGALLLLVAVRRTPARPLD